MVCKRSATAALRFPDTRRRLDEKKNNPPGNTADTKSGAKTLDKPVDRTGGNSTRKTFDKPAGDKNIEKGRLDTNPQPGGPAKKPDKFTLPKDKVVVPPRDKIVIPPKDKVVVPPKDKVAIPPKDKIVVPPKDKVVTPPDLKPKDDRFNPKYNIPNKKDTLNPDRLLPGGKIKDPPKTNPGNPKAGVIPKWTPPGKKTDDAKPVGPETLPGGRGPQNPRNLDPRYMRPDKDHKPFEERVKSGELDAVTKGDVARKLNLADQYKNMHKGDVARRMDLQKHAAKNVNVTNLHNVTINNLKGIHPKTRFSLRADQSLVCQ